MRKFNYIFVLLMICLTYPEQILAHGGGIAQISKQPMEQYIVSVWSSPVPPVVGKFHVTIALTTAENPNQPLLNQPMTVTLQSLSADLPLITSFPTNEQSANRLMYEADFDLTQDGRWQASLFVGEAKNPVTFEFDVVKKGQAIPLWLLLIFGVMGIAVIGFFVAKNRKKR